jgi:hypothetical protein
MVTGFMKLSKKGLFRRGERLPGQPGIDACKKYPVGNQSCSPTVAQGTNLSEMSTRTAFHSELSGGLIDRRCFARYPGFDLPRFATDNPLGEVKGTDSVLNIDDFADRDGARVAAICQRSKTLCVILSFHVSSRFFGAIFRSSFGAWRYVPAMILQDI